MSYKKPILESIYFSSFKDNIPDLTGKSFVVTGTTSGTGKIAAQTLAEKGARVLMLNRPSSRAQQIQDLINKEYPQSDVHTIDCDLMKFSSVQSAAEKVKEICKDGIYALIKWYFA